MRVAVIPPGVVLNYLLQAHVMRVTACSVGCCCCCLFVLPFVSSAAVHAYACSKDSTTAIDCYIELAEKVRTGLSHIDPYFLKLADGMLAWVDCWQKLNPDTIAKAAV